MAEQHQFFNNFLNTIQGVFNFTLTFSTTPGLKNNYVFDYY